MATERQSAATTVASFPEPPLARKLLAETTYSWIWLVLRAWLGWQWLTAGLGKVGSPAWTGENAGAAVTGFVGRALEAGVPGWYAAFLEGVVLQVAPLFGFMVAFGELMIGLALILGALTGLAAFFGTLMNLAFLFAGTVSSNPLFFVIGTWLVLSWRVAGWYGLDRILLPKLGTPWHPGTLFRRAEDSEA
ncbi:MAG: TQO small subunit DoxD [Thermaerobacterales bacterium]